MGDYVGLLNKFHFNELPKWKLMKILGIVKGPSTHNDYNCKNIFEGTRSAVSSIPCTASARWGGRRTAPPGTSRWRSSCRPPGAWPASRTCTTTVTSLPWPVMSYPQSTLAVTGWHSGRPPRPVCRATRSHRPDISFNTKEKEKKFLQERRDGAAAAGKVINFPQLIKQD